MHPWLTASLIDYEEEVTVAPQTNTTTEAAADAAKPTAGGEEKDKKVRGLS